MNTMNQKYNDILRLPRPVSKTHVPMSRENRAAQFAPFAALTGHDAAIEETARLTERRVELDEDALAELDHKWRILREHLEERPLVTITYFKADKQKDGGVYNTVVGTIENVNEQQGWLALSDGTVIPLCDIAALDSELLRCFVGSDDLL